MSKLSIYSHRSHEFYEVHEVTEWKDGSVFKTKSIGFIHKDDAIKYPPDKYVLASISTEKTGGRFCTLEPYIGLD